MAYILDPQIIVPSFNAAISQLASISLHNLGLNITSLPFWLGVIGYPLAMFEVFTKHIATAINVLLRQVHINTVKFSLWLCQLFIIKIVMVTTARLSLIIVCGLIWRL